jgi:hypothetical protein
MACPLGKGEGLVRKADGDGRGALTHTHLHAGELTGDKVRPDHGPRGAAVHGVDGVVDAQHVQRRGGPGTHAPPHPTPFDRQRDLVRVVPFPWLAVPSPPLQHRLHDRVVRVDVGDVAHHLNVLQRRAPNQQLLKGVQVVHH